MTQTSASSSGGQSAGSAQEKASQVAQTAKESGSEVAQTAAEQAKTVAGEASRQTRDLVDEARGQLREQAADQQQKAVSGLRALVEELRSMTQNGGQSGPATELAHQACDRTRRAADWLEQREPTDLLEELRRLGRRRPGAFLTGAALVGVLAGRLTRGVVAASSNDAPPSTNQELAAPAAPQPVEQREPWQGEPPVLGSGYAAGPSGYPPAAPSGPPPAAFPPGTVGGPTYDVPGAYPPVDPASRPGVWP